MKKGHSFKMLLVLLVYASIVSISHGSGVPNTLNYQGTLTDSTGKPVTATAKPVTFKLYTSALGGAAFWTESQTVPVTNGQFSSVLGSTVPLPTDKFTGETYVGVTVDAGPEMLPRQKLTSVAYALKAADAIPKGVIVMWSGSVAQIPDGWTLCDGSIGTPDLRDRFIIGSGGSYALAATGGEAQHNLTINEMPIHNHEITDGAGVHTHPIQNGGNHQHPYSHGSDTTSAGHAADTNNGSPTQYTEYAGIHTHTMDATGGHNHVVNNKGTGQSHNNLPPYYALAFIMKL